MIANLFGPDLGIVVVIIILVVLFGSQLPKIARNVGMAGREFRKAQQEAEEEAERERVAKAAAATAAAPSVPASPVAPPPAAVGPAPAAPPPLTANRPTGDESVTLTRAELDALLKAREEQVRKDAPGSGN